MTSYENMYDGSTSPLEPVFSGNPVYSSIEYQVPFSNLGTHVDPRTANQIKEVSEALNTGVRNVEVQGTQPEILESIPKQHFEEIRRLAKLSGAELSFHAPMIDPSGLTQHGWEKMNQDAAERELWHAVQRSHDLDPNGNIPVTIHASTAQLPPAEFKVMENGKEKIKSILLIDPNGNIGQIKEEERYFPTEAGQKIGEKVPFDPVKELKRRNAEVWLGQLNSLNYYAHQGDNSITHSSEILDDFEKAAKEYGTTIEELEKEERKGELDKNKIDLLNIAKNYKKELDHGALYLRDAYVNLKKNFDIIYKNSEGKDRKKLNDFAQKMAPKVEAFDKIKNDSNELREFSNDIQEGVKILGDVRKPEVYKPLREFAVDKTAETVANLAVSSYKQFGSSAPIISVENHPANMSVLTKAEDIREVIEQSRKKFVEKAKQQGYSEGDAKQMSEKLIGATWDVGHINQLRKFGYGKEDIIKQSKTIAPYVKHVHLSDNFGYENTELPMGMGNVPMKEILGKLGQEGFKGKQIVEAAAWWQHFSPGGKQSPPIVPTMQAMSSPLYAMAMGPTWEQIYGTSSGYFSGYGAINPEIHHSLYGAGFSSLPQELGGQIAGKDSRMTGTPMS